jgi:hypothetical protein
MIQNNIKKTLNAAKPYLERFVGDTARGYVFGCVMGVFTHSRKSTLESMHSTGKNFAAMSAAYSATEISMEAIRKKKDVLNSVVAGAAAGAVGSRKGPATGSLVFGVYSGISAYLQKTDKNM